MLTEIVLKNFQRHKRKRIRLDKITCLVGPTERGKSAMVRALRLLATGQPSGAKFVRHKQTKMEVGILIDGKRVKRLRGKRVNEYRMGKKAFKSFGAGKVPHPVTEFLNLDDSNFQSQHDAFFWLFDAPPKIAKSLNKIANLEEIDTATQTIALRLRRKTVELSLVEERLAELVREGEGCEWITECEKDFAALLKAWKGYRKISHKTRELALSVESGKSATKRFNRARIALQVLETQARGAKRVDTTFQTWKRAEGRRRDLWQLFSRFDRVSRKASAAGRLLSDAEELAASRTHGDKRAEDRRTLEFLLQDIKKTEEQMKVQEAEIIKLETKLKGSRCPLCGASNTRKHRKGHAR